MSSSDENESGHSDIVLGSKFKKQKNKVLRQIISDDESECEDQVPNTTLHLPSENNKVLRQIISDDESECEDQVLNTTLHLLSENIVEKIDADEDIATCNKVEAWLSNQPFFRDTNEEPCQREKNECNETLEFESAVHAGNNGTSATCTVENILENVDEMEPFDDCSSTVHKENKDLSLPCFRLPTPDLDLFVLEAENLVNVDFNKPSYVDLPISAKASKKSHICQSTLNSFSPLTDNIIVLSEGYESIKESALEKFKAKFFKQAQQNSSACKERCSDGIASSTLSHSDSSFGKADMSALNREELKEKLMCEIVRKKEEAFNRSKEIEHLDEENQSFSEEETVESKRDTDHSSLSSDSSMSEDEEEPKLTLLNDNENKPEMKSVSEIKANGMESANVTKATLEENSGFNIEKFETSEGLFFNDLPYSSSAIPSHQPHGGFPTHSDSIMSDASASNSALKSHFCIEKVSQNSNLTEEEKPPKNLIFPEPDKESSVFSNMPHVRVPPFESTFDDSLSNPETSGFDSQDVNNFCSGEFQDVSEAPWSPEGDDVSQISAKADDDCSSVSSRSSVASDAMAKIRAKGTAEDEVDLSQFGFSGDKINNGAAVQDDHCNVDFSDLLKDPLPPEENICQDVVEANDDDQSTISRSSNKESHASAVSEILKGFLDDEAELSGEEDSGDEIDQEDDYEEDDGNGSERGDIPSDDALREEIAPLHLKQMAADDDEQLYLVKEAFLDDGELASMGGRQKKFTWKTQEEQFNQFKPESDSEEDEQDNKAFEFEDKVKWRQQQSVEDESDSEHVVASSSRKLQLSIDIIGKCHSLPDEQVQKGRKRQRGSFLCLQEDYSSNVLKKLKKSDCDPSGSRTTKHFIFRNHEVNEDSKEKENWYTVDRYQKTIAAARASSEISSAFDDIVSFL